MKRRYGKTERRFTKFFRRFISAKRRLGFMCLRGTESERSIGKVEISVLRTKSFI